jgi:acylphosphatase
MKDAEKMTTNSCLHCLITGLVQGVWFRGSTQKQAQNLGLKGYARNLSDGRVEVIACGNSSALEILQNWLHKGPATAHVDSVTCEKMNVPDNFTDFVVR